MSHPWRSKGEKRTVVWYYKPPAEVVQYLQDMQDAIRYALQVAYLMATRDSRGRIPSAIALRRELRDWFYSRYDYARHHINPVCRTAVAMLKSYRKNHHELRIPEVKKLAMRFDAELFKLADGKIRVTLQPNNYTWVLINTMNKRYEEYSRGKPSELLITDRKVCLTFVVGKGTKPLGSKIIASDLNFNTVDSTKASLGSAPKLEAVKTESIKHIAQIQNDFSRRRRQVQLHVKNAEKRAKKLKETRGRQRNRIKDALHKLSTEQVKKNPDGTFIFEDLKGIRKNWKSKNKKLRTYLNRWPYRMYQSMVEYKSRKRTLFVSPGGTSSRCPVCGDRLEHPTWAVSRCNKCGVDYDRDRLASLAILCRALRLCGQPFAVSAEASWQHMRDEYLHTPVEPDNGRADWTKNAVNAPNLNVYTKIHI
jgi:putative transposase